jgi:xylulose-5-phosphate/fructose-6-phosphate phosphoketolase
MEYKLTSEQLDKLKKYFRAANYLTATQIYLKDNYLLERELRLEDIKPRLLGHWGTCPGISFVYTMLNFLQTQTPRELLYMVGTGHGFPAIQANLFLEKTLQNFYPKATHTREGIEYISKNFSWPYGFPSHSSPETPGIILEGGELGYALSTAYGSVLDNTNLTTVCLIGDGEAETGPTATAWHINKFINPKINGTVLPILHLNGYKISGPTIFGRMSNEELNHLFTGYGYEVFFVEYDEENPDVIFETMYETLQTAFDHISQIKNSATDIVSPHLPMIILRTPKGWTGVKEYNGEKLEGNFASHQVILKEVHTDVNQLKELDTWLSSYKFKELFDPYKGFIPDIQELAPQGEFRLGMNKYAHAQNSKKLLLPDVHRHAEDASHRGVMGSSSMRRVGEYLYDVFKLNKDNFRLFSPDETYSNKLDKVFEITKRAFVWPIKSFDKDIGQHGRVIEMLSEHSLQGLLQGYVLTGRHGIFASYEAFIQIVASMADQYAKFLKIARTIPWRNSIPSFNYILTSSGWRQEHNGFSHQNPGFIDDMFQRQGDFVHVYFPPDGNSSLACIEEMLDSRDSINILVAGKTVEPRWLSIDEARVQLKTGFAIWGFASDENPDIIFSSMGDYVTKEMLAAIQILKQEIPTIKIRYVNNIRLSSDGFVKLFNAPEGENFDYFYTKNKPVIFNFHGFPQTLKQMLFDYPGNVNRFKINGYIENGSTTTSFDMQIRNKTSRYDLVIQAMSLIDDMVAIKERRDAIVSKYQRKLSEYREFIIKNGIDSEEIEQWTWNA